jgi:hypothetical protein
MWLSSSNLVRHQLSHNHLSYKTGYYEKKNKVAHMILDSSVRQHRQCRLKLEIEIVGTSPYIRIHCLNYSKYLEAVFLVLRKQNRLWHGGGHELKQFEKNLLIRSWTSFWPTASGNKNIHDSRFAAGEQTARNSFVLRIDKYNTFINCLKVL